MGLVSFLLPRLLSTWTLPPETLQGRPSRAVLYLTAAQQFTSTKLLAAGGALPRRFGGLVSYFSTLAGETSLSLRGSQEVGVDATYGKYVICDMLVPQLPDSGLLHYLHQASLEIAPPFTPLAEFSTLVGERHAVEGPGGKHKGQRLWGGLAGSGNRIRGPQERTEKQKEVETEE